MLRQWYWDPFQEFKTPFVSSTWYKLNMQHQEVQLEIWQCRTFNTKILFKKCERWSLEFMFWILIIDSKLGSAKDQQSKQTSSWTTGLCNHHSLYWNYLVKQLQCKLHKAKNKTHLNHKESSLKIEGVGNRTFLFFPISSILQAMLSKHGQEHAFRRNCKRTMLQLGILNLPYTATVSALVQHSKMHRLQMRLLFNHVENCL
jgi:hypothetical protein